MKKPIYACLWFNTEAQEAATYYTSIFKDSRVLSSNPMVTNFELNGTRFMALNGQFSFAYNESVSFVVECETQAEIDHYWDHFTREGKPGKCGWLKDKYGVSWQIVPSILGELMSDPARSQRVVQAFMQMTKFDIEKLKQA